MPTPIDIGTPNQAINLRFTAPFILDLDDKYLKIELSLPDHPISRDELEKTINNQVDTFKSMHCIKQSAAFLVRVTENNPQFLTVLDKLVEEADDKESRLWHYLLPKLREAQDHLALQCTIDLRPHHNSTLY